MFSGIGAFEKALENLGIPFDLVNYCEINKNASRSYSLIHGVSEDKNLWDITRVDEKSFSCDIDVVTYGFPCQDISVAGTQKGLFNTDGSKTRSGLFFDALRIIAHTSPKIAIAENVKNLVGTRFAEQFEVVLKSLEAAGYNNYFAVLNSKDYGVPQSRERVFIVSIRKDVDAGDFKFPKPQALDLRLRDVLEPQVDEKYYLSPRMVQEYVEKPADGVKTSLAPPKIIVTGSLEHYHNKLMNCVYDPNGIAPTIMVVSGGGREKKIMDDFGIRRLTPLECLRLMGFGDSDYQALRQHKVSNTQMYKQTGNSIVVNVLEEIFRSLFDSVPLKEVAACCSQRKAKLSC